MDLTELSSGAIGTKGWLNIVAGDIKSETLEAKTITADNVEVKTLTVGTLFALVFGYGSVTTVSGSGNLTAAQVVNGVAGGIAPGGILALPSAADIVAFIGAVPPTIPFYNFVFRFSNASFAGGNYQLNPGAGTSLFDGQPHIIINAGLNKVITFAFTPGGWIIYY